MQHHKENCIFCKIIHKEIPSFPVYEDDDFIAFLDAFPCAPGHVQVIPKNHERWVWDVENFDEYFKVVQKVALAMRKAYNTELVRSKVFGEEVHHAHVWLWADGEKDGTEKDFALHQEKIVSALSQ
jgi:histidine triad (HIT) family protein